MVKAGHVCCGHKIEKANLMLKVVALNEVLHMRTVSLVAAGENNVESKTLRVELHQRFKNPYMVLVRPELGWVEEVT